MQGRKLEGAGLMARPPTTAQEAMASLADPRGMFKPLIRDRIDAVRFDDLPEPLADFMRALKAEMGRYGIPMAFMESWRSAGRQAELAAAGRSLAAPNASAHQFGLAFDYVHAVRGWKLTPAEWAQIGAIGLEVARKRKVPMEWGGAWKFYDPAHWQIKGWRNWQSVMMAMGLDEAHRPDAGQWSTIMSKAAPALLRR